MFLPPNTRRRDAHYATVKHTGVEITDYLSASALTLSIADRAIVRFAFMYPRVEKVLCALCVYVSLLLHCMPQCGGVPWVIMLDHSW